MSLTDINTALLALDSKKSRKNAKEQADVNLLILHELRMMNQQINQQNQLLHHFLKEDRTK